jgi:hypothetical protein
LKPEAQRKSSQKEMPYRLRGERHCAWSTTFKKVDETIVQSECEHTDKPQFNHMKRNEIDKELSC